MRRLWTRAFIAFLAMELLMGMSWGARYMDGPDSEFGGPSGAAVFAAVIGVPYILGGLLGVILPVAVLVQRLRWSLSPATAVLLGAVLSVPTFALIVVCGWLFDGTGSLVEFAANVLRFRQANVTLLGVFAVGGAIVLSSQCDDGMWPRARWSSWI